jgi:hypothetical protein
MLAKESTLILPGLFLIYVWAFGSKLPGKTAVGWFFIVVSSAIIYFLLRKAVLGTLASGIEPGYLLKERMLRLGIVYSTYLWMLFVPHDCRFFYGHVTKNMTFTPIDLALLGVPITLAAIAMWSRKRTPVVAFSLFTLSNSLYYESKLAWARRVTQTNLQHKLPSTIRA